MMHSNNFVLAVKHNGKILRENKNKQVFLPFNSEYQLLIKNLNKYRKAIANIEIDGMYISGSQEFQINANSTAIIERFILDGNLTQGRKFKFVEKYHPNVSDPTNKENGIIKVTFWLERVQYPIIPDYIISYPNTWEYYPYYPNMWEYYPYYVYNDNTNTNDGYKSEFNINSTYCSNSCTSPSKGITRSISPGATIEGDKSQQQFTETTKVYKDFATETILQLQLMPFANSVTVNQPKYCPRCGAKQKYHNKFCPNCGLKL